MSTSTVQHLQGKTCLVTGSSRGIGYQTAAGLASLGAHVIIVSHNKERIDNAQKRLITQFGEQASRAYQADLSVQADVHKFADQIQRDYDHLDVLVNNVGGWFSKFQESADGIELTFALNHLSYFLLTGRLLNLLINGTHARIVNVSSDAHRAAKGIRFDDVQFKQGYRVFSAYAHSKLANVMFTYELARLVEGTSVSVNALHPGFVKSELYRHFGIMTPFVNFLATLFGKTEEEGAQTPIYLASSPEVDGTSGKYYAEKEQVKSSPISYDAEQAARLWAISEEMTGFSYPI
jgi:NAD(P)-dependent dehydrogenase (short-subunit alcohol dehydrogenase family)